MDSLFSLLRLDRLAQPTGGGLKPELRAAMEAQARFPSVAASPQPQTPVDPADLPENVTVLHPDRTETDQKSA